MGTSIVQEKVDQAIGILEEKGIDLWLTFVRESDANTDPIVPAIYGANLTWESALIITSSGETSAVVGKYEVEAAQRVGAYRHVTSYQESIGEALVGLLAEHNPQKIAINTSVNDFLADGLTHGMYLRLLGYLEGTPFEGRLVSAEHVIQALRGRKTPGEVARIRRAVQSTEAIYAETFEQLREGMTEMEVGAFMHSRVRARGLDFGWEEGFCPLVNTGPESSFGHCEPTDLAIERGHLVHFDFGVRQDGYCSDIQRMVYFLRPDESEPPEAVQRGFDTVCRAIHEAVAAMRPGVRGSDVDQVARDVITGAGYPYYEYGTGHQLGRLPHDGGTILAPPWPRYGDCPTRSLEAGNVFTVEPGLFVEGHGWMSLEEDVLVTEDGAEFLGTPQTELILK